MPRSEPKKGAVAELVACLMKAPRTAADIPEMVDMSPPTVRAWLAAFNEAGVIRRKGIRPAPPGISSAGSMEYEWQRYPFEFEDAAP